MSRVEDFKGIGKKLLSTRAIFATSIVAVLLFVFGGSWMSYLSTATRLVSDEVSEKIPVDFEIERARTMIANLIPDIKRNMVVIAHEEVSVESIRKEIAGAEEALKGQREVLVELGERVKDGSEHNPYGDRVISSKELKEELKHLFARYKMQDATLQAKQEVLASRERSLAASRAKLQNMLNAKRDLEVEVENLQARLRAIQTESVANEIEFDETQLTRCQQLVDDLRVRLNVAERLIAAEGTLNFEDVTSSTLSFSEDEDIAKEIDNYFTSTSRQASFVKEAH